MDTTRDFPLFVAAGEALTDMIVADGGATRWHSQVGGSTWNVARAMARLGVATGFAGAVSRDVFGDQLWQASQDAGLDLRLLQRVDKSPLLAIVHLFRHLKGAYRLSWPSATWRTVLMLGFILLIIPLFGFLLLTLGIAD